MQSPDVLFALNVHLLLHKVNLGRLKIDFCILGEIPAPFFNQVSCFSEDLYLDRAVRKIPNWLVWHLVQAPSLHAYAMNSNGSGSWLCRDFCFFDCNHVHLDILCWPNWRWICFKLIFPSH
jgi:hypothetical protein